MENRYEQILRKDWEKFNKENQLFPNILLLGATGCGKSSLINTIFHKQVAAVNDVSRGTEDFQTYRGKDYDIGVNLIDSRGYEMEDGKGESFTKYAASVDTLIKENRQKKPLEQIHIVWYCISILGSVQEYDRQVLMKLLNEPNLRNRIGVVLTKCDEDDSEGSEAKIFKNIIKEDFGFSLPIFEVSTDLTLDLDVENLIEWSASQIDDKDMREAFVASQIVNLKKKRETAAKEIAGFSAAAAAIGAVPIPFSDAALLVPLQLAMSTAIIHSYGMESFATISKSVIGNIVISNLGKSFAGGILKLIPGIGTLAGGAINAGVAALITSALGFAISEICYNSCKKIAQGENVDFANLFDLDSIKDLTNQFIKTHKGSEIMSSISPDDKAKAEEYIRKYDLEP